MERVCKVLLALLVVLILSESFGVPGSFLMINQKAYAKEVRQLSLPSAQPTKSLLESSLAVLTEQDIPTDTEAPTAPTGFAVAAKTDTSVSLSWTASIDNVGVTGYEIYRDGTKISTSTVISYTDSGLTANTTYIYTVKAYDAAGNVSSASNTLLVLTLEEPARQIVVDGNAADWDGILPLCSGDDTITSLSAYEDNTELYILVKGTDLNTPFSVFIDSDNNPLTGYQSWGDWADCGAEYLIQDDLLYQYTGGSGNDWSWIQLGLISISKTDTVNEIALNLSQIDKNAPADLKLSYYNDNRYAPVYGSNMAQLIIPSDIQAPAVPTGFTVTTKTDTSVSLSWTASTDNVGVTGYEIYADGIIIDNGMGTTFIHEELTPNTQHTYSVRAKNESGTSDWSSLLTVITNSESAEDTDAINAYIENTSITLTWSVVNDAESYEVEFDGKVVNCGPNTFCIKANLMPLSQHSYRIRAVKAEGTGEWSSLSAITTYLLDTPNNIVTDEKTDNISLTWDPVEGASQYEIYDGDVIIGITAENTYIHSGLSPETRHTYKVKAIGPSGESAFSTPASIYTLPVKPPVPTNVAAMIVDNMVTIYWDTVEGAIGYDVELDGILIDNGDNTIYTHEELDKSTKHTYRVRAKNEAIEGDWSSLLDLKTMEGKPVPPSGIKVSTTPTITTLTWEPQDDALSYDVEVDGVVMESISETNFRHRRITPLTEHVYRIRTINITGVSPWSGYIINNSIRAVCKKGNDVNLGLTASDIMDFSKYILTVSYNPDVLEVTDLSTLSPDIELDGGKIEGTGINITSFTPGYISFTVDKSILPGESWSGIINSIKFKSKVTGGTSITYAVFSLPDAE